MQRPLALKFKNIHDSIAANANNELAKQGLTLSQVIITDYLRLHPNENVIARDLEQALHLAHPTVTGILKRMEQKGLISIVPDKEDLRRKNIRLLNSDKITECSEHHKAELEKKLTFGLSEEETATLHRLLDIVLRNISSDTD